MKITELKRNDIEAAKRFYEERGVVTTDEVRVLARLQDDETELLNLARGWKVHRVPGLLEEGTELLSEEGTGPRPRKGSARS